jgi:hypothetical protein
MGWACVTKGGIAGFPRILAVVRYADAYKDVIDPSETRIDLHSH